MAQDDERLTESNSNINSNNEEPAKPFAITMEFPLLVVMMGMSLSGKSTTSNVCWNNFPTQLYLIRIFLIKFKE